MNHTILTVLLSMLVGMCFPRNGGANHGGPILQTNPEVLWSPFDWLGSTFGFIMLVFAFFTLVFIVLIILFSPLLDAFGEPPES